MKWNKNKSCTWITTQLFNGKMTLEILDSKTSMHVKHVQQEHTGQTFMFASAYISRLLLHYISIRFCFCNSWAWYRQNHYRLSQEILTSSLTQTHINLAAQKQSCFLHMHWIKLMWIIVCLFTIHCLLNDAFQQYPFSTHKHDKTQQA